MKIRLLGACSIACALLLGCGERIDPEKIYAITLRNGNRERTLHIPGAYIPRKESGGRTDSSIWIDFSYPSMRPSGPAVTADSVALLVMLDSPTANPLSRSEISLEMIKRQVGIQTKIGSTRHLGELDGFDIYEETTQSGLTTRISLVKDRDGTLICFSDPNFRRVTAERKYADVLELRYIFPKSLEPQKMEVDQAVLKLMDQFMEKR
jgi:hypothetical protein